MNLLFFEIVHEAIQIVGMHEVCDFVSTDFRIHPKIFASSVVNDFVTIQLIVVFVNTQRSSGAISFGTKFFYTLHQKFVGALFMRDIGFESATLIIYIYQLRGTMGDEPKQSLKGKGEATAVAVIKYDLFHNILLSQLSIV